MLWHCCGTVVALLCPLHVFRQPLTSEPDPAGDIGTDDSSTGRDADPDQPSTVPYQLMDDT